MERPKTPAYQTVIQTGLDIANGRHPLSKAIPPLLFVLDVCLCALVIWKINYTEIDWSTYMQQVSQFLKGERDYTKIEGSTGPLVYPAAHVYIYAGLYYLTDKGNDIFLAQQIFALLYLATLAVVMACYIRAKAPTYLLPLLILSKRLHSIFVLRCFNDCFAVFFLWLTIFNLQQRRWTVAAVTYSLGLGVKMSLLLVLPGMGTVLLLGRGFQPSLRLASLMAQAQLALGMPFLAINPRGYLGRAFELSRQFLFRWTVNWRFVGEEVFLSRGFAIGLLVAHVSLLSAFVTFRWLQPAGKPVAALVQPILRGSPPFTRAEETQIARRVSPRYILATMLSANAIGLLVARSLHYQFYAYVAWATPFLLWHGGLHPVLIYLFWVLQEWAWNVYPSTPNSSAVVVGTLAVTVLAAWFGPVPKGELVATEEKAK